MPAAAAQVLRLAAALIFAAATTGGASEDVRSKFDGRYKQANSPDCADDGQDGGALVIENGTFFGVESRCEMTRPTTVRDMDAVLYDMNCTGEGESWTARAMFMTANDGGIVMVWNGFAFHYTRCAAAEPPARTDPPAPPR